MKLYARPVKIPGIRSVFAWHRVVETAPAVSGIVSRSTSRYTVACGIDLSNPRGIETSTRVPVKTARCAACDTAVTK